MTGLLSWAEAFEAGPSVCGGKGYNLARLARYGFRVPQGGVLPTGAPLTEIREGLERLGLTAKRVAVRSSATAEDSARASFAGIHRSFLNVFGADAVEQAAKGCIDSLQTDEARAYRRRMGFTDDEVRCAVVICEMVDARAAGVAFSCDPATGRRDLILIDATEGLADKLVQGQVTPKRSVWRKLGELLERVEGPAVLPPDREEELAYVVERVQWALGAGNEPQDVEWAYDGEHNYLVQARPVTALPRAGWTEIAHIPRYWSTANLKDNLPGAPCELSWSAVCAGIRPALYASQDAGGYALPEGMEILRRYRGRAYFDLTSIQWAFYDAFGLAPADVVKTIGGSQPEIEVPPNPLKGAAGRRRQMNGLRLLRRLWGNAGKGRRALEATLRFEREHRAIDWTAASHQGLNDAFDAVGKMQRENVAVAGLANGMSGPWQLALEALVRDADLIGRLQAGSGAVASAEAGYRLYDVARGRTSLADFMDEFGHHAVHEAEFLNPRWVEDPSWILEQIETIRANPDMPDPRALAIGVRERAETEVKRRFGLRAPLVLWLARKLRAAVAEREAAKSAMIGLMLPIRRMVLEIGRRLTARGDLDSPGQALYFSAVDVICWLRGYWDGSGAGELARDRIARREAWLAEDAPDLIIEERDGRTIAPPVAVPVSGGADTWTGIAVSPGVASGRVRIMRTLEEWSRLQPGDVLAAASTDPGWTPLMLRASAIIVEIGGFLSHGSIVAREFGIPAVANIPGILDALRDGERVSVDGSNGRVTRL